MRPCVAGLLMALAIVLSAHSAQATTNFTFDCGPQRYLSVPTGTFHEFLAPIRAVAPNDDFVEVIFEPHLPNGWFAQWCQTSTGICYLGNETIRLTVGVRDTLRVDIFPHPSTPGFGYAEITVRSVADPLDFGQCTYTLFSGQPVPNVFYSLDCRDNTAFLDQGDYHEFSAPLRNLKSTPDSLFVRMTPDLPGNWFAQFCQTSTGVCYLDEAVLYLPPNAVDTLRVDFFMFGQQGAGSAELEVRSRKNPSLVNYCLFQVFLGNYSADAGEAPQAPLTGVQIAPNPFQGSTVLRLNGPAGSTARLAIFGPDGRLVRGFPEKGLPEGRADVRWDGRSDDGTPVPAGVYFYRFHSGHEESRGMIVRTR